ncbi:hypothetical protein COLO4_17726 [Corchorus olitorius]|uniref:Bromo domain-containing protein n=1 Tax=Corchorus olitorius TaxID=93759 RepID=A0A1R3JBX5_9ROSI|nr:hypothetical protein COLO4_17726 [Corchorus olitorius]
MRTKRKRACRKPPARKPPAKKAASVAQNETAENQTEEAFLNFIHQNNKEKSVSADSNDLGVADKKNCVSDGAKSSPPSSPSSSDSDESFNAGENSSDDSSSVDRRSRKSTKGHGNGKQQASKLPKKGRDEDVTSSRILRSSSQKQNEFKMPQIPQQDSHYNKKELKAALEVITKIMKMDEARPFNVPADPVAMGKPDYYSVIDTPMDFGTICSNLENGIKYMNSGDVFNDAQYIWENCLKCCKKGEYIVYLMKLVKKKFMKYWTAAGLSTEQSRKTNVGNLYGPSTTDYATKDGRPEAFYPGSHAVDGVNQIQQDRLGSYQPYQYVPPLSYNQPYPFQQPPPSTAWPQLSQLPQVSYYQPSQSQQPQPSINQPQFSQLQARTGCNSAGYSHFQPPKDIAPKHKKHGSSSKHKNNASMGPASSVYGGAPSHSHSQHPQLIHQQPYGLQQQQQQNISQLQSSRLPAVADGGYSYFQPPTDIAQTHKNDASTSKHKRHTSVGPASSIYGGPASHSQSQHPQLSHKQPFSLQQHQQSISPLQPSQLQDVADGGHLNLPSQADFTRGSGYVPLGPVDPMVVAPGQSHRQQFPLSDGESSEPHQLQPQTSHYAPQSSQLQNRVDIEQSNMSLTDSALRGINCALRYSAGPTTNKTHQEIPSQLGPTEVQSKQIPQSQDEQHQTPDRLKRKKRGRGPTRCLFLNDLADGERIFVHFNKFGQPVGPEASKLSSFLGTVARNGHRAPLNFVHWRAMPDSYKEDMWEYVQTKFDIDPIGKAWVLQSVATKWRDWKADLKATYYDTLNTDEERLKVKDPRVVPEQWPSLIEYWNSDETKSKIREQAAKKQDDAQCSDDSKDTLFRVIGKEKRNRILTYGLGTTRSDVFGPRPSRNDLMVMAYEAKKSANEEVQKMVVKMEAMEEKYARLETQIARMTSSMEKFLEKIGGSSQNLGFEQIKVFEEIEAEMNSKEEAFMDFVYQNANVNYGVDDSDSDSDDDDESASNNTSSSSSGSDEDFSLQPSIDWTLKRGKQKISHSLNEARSSKVKSRYSKKELELALMVIKKVMKMDEAQPFNVPFDPIAFGLPQNYVNFIDSPMDFGIIWSNLRNGVKYMNSEDVYMDVKQIWENCYKFSKKGDYTFYLIKRVKKIFLKYWREAGLYSKPSRGISNFSMRQRQHELTHFPSSCYHPDQLQKPPHRTIWSQISQLQQSINGHPHQLEQPQPSYNSLHFSKLQPGTYGASAALKSNKGVPSSLVRPIIDSASHAEPQQIHLWGGQPNCVQQTEHNTSQMQPPQAQAVEDTGQSRLSPAQSVRGGEAAGSYALGPVTNSPSQECENHSDHDHRQPKHPSAGQNQPSASQNEPYETQRSTQKHNDKKKTRVPRYHNLLDSLNGEPVVIPINKLGQPVGPKVSLLSHFLGKVSRDGHLSKFDIELRSKRWVLKTISRCWRNWKAKLKAQHYYPHNTQEEQLNDCHPKVLPDQWQSLVLYWNSDKAKLNCAKNRASRAQQMARHTTGTKSFARLREEERAKRPDGKEPSRAEIYILSHTRKDGRPVDDAAAAIISKLREQATQRQTVSGDGNDSHDTLYQVLGSEKPGQVRTYGLGPTPSDIWGEKCVCQKMKTSTIEEEKIIFERMNSMEQKYAHLEARIDRLTSNMQKFLASVGASSKILGIDQQTLDASDGDENPLQPHVDGSSPNHAVPSDEITDFEDIEAEMNSKEAAFLDFVNQNAYVNYGVEESDSDSDSDSDDASARDNASSSSSGNDEDYSSESTIDRALRRGKRKISHSLNKGRSSKIIRSRYNEKELQLAAMVIKKVMKLDEAQPFNVPFDPVAFGLSNYANVIDSPMDFGIIWSNLRNGVKYMNSEDVYMDVKQIWENCYKFSKKGDYTFHLIKRVKKLFFKYWTEAGLYSKPSQEISNFSTRQSQCELAHLPSSYHPHQLQKPPQRTIWSQLSQLQQSIYSHHHQLEQPLPQPSYNTPHYSQLQTDTFGSTPGSAMIDSASQPEPQQIHLRERQPNCVQQPEHSTSQLQPPHVQAAADIGQSHLSPAASMRGGRAPCTDAIDPASNSLIQEHEAHSDPNLQQPNLPLPGQNQPSQSQNEPNETQRSQRKRNIKRKTRVRSQDNNLLVSLDGEPIFIPTNELGQPVGPKATMLSNFIGKVAKDGHLAPLSYITWRKMPNEAREEMWRLVRLLSAVNKACRAKQKALHTAGRKSFARIREEEKEKRPGGKEPSRAELYILTHTRKDGQPVDDAAAEIIAKLREKASQKQTVSGDSNNSQDTLFQVIGSEKTGRVRTYGMGPTPTELWGQKCVCHKTRIPATEEENSILEKMKMMEKKYARMEARMNRMTSKILKYLVNIGASSNILQESLNTSDADEDQLQPNVDGSSSNCAVPSDEAASGEE